MDKVLSQIYYSDSSPKGYASPTKLFYEAKKQLPDLRRADVEEWLASQFVPTKYANKRRVKRPPFLVSHAGYMLGCDLGDLRKNPTPKRLSWICIVQDLFTRQIIGAVGQRNKTSTATAVSLNSILSEWKTKHPETSFSILYSDRGRELMGACNEVYEKWDLKHEVTDDDAMKVSPTEKALGLLKARLWKIMAAEKSKDWNNFLPQAVKAHNSAYNRNLRMTPNEAAKPANADKVWSNLHGKFEAKQFIALSKKLEKKQPIFRYKIGDQVRMRIDGAAFHKTFWGLYSTMVYEVTSRYLSSFLPRYELADALTEAPIAGSFAEGELIAYSGLQQVHPLPEEVHIKERRIEPDGTLQIRLEVPAGELREILPDKKWIDYKDLLKIAKKHWSF